LHIRIIDNMPSLLKQLIWNLTDFEFLASISSVDFHNRKVNVKRHFWNTLIGKISDNVALESENDIKKIITTIKKLYEVRLGLVNAHSMKRFFLKNIFISFKSFSNHIDSFFKKHHRDKRAEMNQSIVERKRNKRRKLREKKKELKRQQPKPEGVPPIERQVAALNLSADTHLADMETEESGSVNQTVDHGRTDAFVQDLLEDPQGLEDYVESGDDISINQFMEENFEEGEFNTPPPDEVTNPPETNFLVDPEDPSLPQSLRATLRFAERDAALATMENRPYEYDNTDPLFTETQQRDNLDELNRRARGLPLKRRRVQVYDSAWIQAQKDADD